METMSWKLMKILTALKTQNFPFLKTHFKNMRLEQLETQWKRIDNKEIQGGFHSIRISPDSIPDLYIGFDRDGLRNLILSIPKPHSFRFKGVAKQNLSIDFFEESNHIVIKLVSSVYSDLFNDLILSLYKRICYMSNAEDYGNELIKAFYRWSGFFTDYTTNGLTDDVIKGLFGELTLLKELVKQSDSFSIDEVLESWKGPFDARNDFESDTKCTEVKTKEETKTEVRISSEFQLTLTPDKSLSLCIVSVSVNHEEGLTISELIDSVKELISERNGEMGILINALLQKGLFGGSLPLYDHLKFKPLEMSFYDCSADNFPKITSQNITLGIFEVSYNLRISQLEEFKISQIKL
ncbi:PD-(D/E)XK motif protein [Pedobacter frigiditerrae]|uniref:PD-(D/E)XK motif protein n=2 Tax=Pedobacter frigiditerrae TaxID=2530452 RepID=A0A4R0MQ38_9SPHI|nr:PD-(D/E)XK motif protein [Pedobacter frigiditerrae]